MILQSRSDATGSHVMVKGNRQARCDHRVQALVETALHVMEDKLSGGERDG